MTNTESRLVALSQWIDSAQGARDSEAITWGRLAKVCEEAGEVIEAWIGVTNQNPRKGVTHNLSDVCEELLDVAVTALAAYEHLTDHNGDAIAALFIHINSAHRRAGLDE